MRFRDRVLSWPTWGLAPAPRRDKVRRCLTLLGSFLRAPRRHRGRRTVGAGPETLRKAGWTPSSLRTASDARPLARLQGPDPPSIRSIPRAPTRASPRRTRHLPDPIWKTCWTPRRDTQNSVVRYKQGVGGGETGRRQKLFQLKVELLRCEKKTRVRQQRRRMRCWEPRQKPTKDDNRTRNSSNIKWHSLKAA